MKTHRLILLLAIPLLLGAGCDPTTYISKFIPKSKGTATVGKVTCDYGGKSYDKGAVRASEDTCNACTCGEQGWSCTTYICKSAPGGLTGIVKGKIARPDDNKNATIQVCAEPISGPELRCAAIPAGETSYALQLPLGRWWVYAAIPGDASGRRAYWTEAVKCGLSSECTDHSLLTTNFQQTGAEAEASPTDWALANRVQTFLITPSKHLDNTFFYDGAVFQLTGHGAESVEIQAIMFPGEETDPPKSLGRATLLETDKDGLQKWTLPVPLDLNARDVWAKVVTTDGMTFRWKSLGWIRNEKTLHPDDPTRSATEPL